MVTKSLDDCGVLLRSQPYASEGGVDAVTSGRVLPWLGGTLPALLAVLSRMAWAERHQGGLTCDSRRSSCAALLAHFLRSLPAGSGLVLFMDIEAALSHHPLPDRGTRPVVVIVQGGGSITWPVCPHGFQDSWSHWTKDAYGRPLETLAAFSQHVQHMSSNTWLLKQLWRQVGKLLDAAILAHIYEEAEPTELACNMDLQADESVATSSDVVMEARLMKHFHGCKRACRGRLMHLSWTTDGSRVASLNLQVAAAALPKHVCFQLMPQVLTHSKEGTDLPTRAHREISMTAS